MTEKLPKLPRHLQWWGGNIRVRRVIPADCVEKLGTKVVYRTLGTACISLAINRASSVLAEVQQRINDARGEARWHEPALPPATAPRWGSVARVVNGKTEEIYLPASQLPAIPEKPAEPVAKVVPFASIIELWANERKTPPATRRDFAAKLARFAAFLGHHDAANVAGDDIIAYKETLIAPSSGLSHKTVENCLAAIKTIFKFAAANRKIPTNPGQDITFSAKQDPRTARLPFSPGDRWTIYQAALAETDPLRRWGNLLPLFSGMRCEEYAESDSRDVKEIDGVWCLLLNYDHRAPNQNLKTDESIRKIPLHSAILAAGFLDYVATLPPGPLFPSLKPDQDGRLAANASDRLGRWLRNVAKITDPRRVNHSHRHSAETLMEAAGVPKSRAYAITGHAAADVGEGYIHRDVAALKEAIEAIPVPREATVGGTEPVEGMRHEPAISQR